MMGMTGTERAGIRVRVAERRARADAATPGPWYPHGDHVAVEDHDPERCEPETNYYPPLTFEEFHTDADVEFIAAARTALAAACDEEDALLDEILRLREVLTAAGIDPDEELLTCVHCGTGVRERDVFRDTDGDPWHSACMLAVSHRDRGRRDGGGPSGPDKE